MKYTALIVAAGSGSRMGLGYNKMLFTLKNGRTILEETIACFRQDKRCHQIIVVASLEDMETFMQLCAKGMWYLYKAVLPVRILFIMG